MRVHIGARRRTQRQTPLLPLAAHDLRSRSQWGEVLAPAKPRLQGRAPPALRGDGRGHLAATIADAGAMGGYVVGVLVRLLVPDSRL